MQRNHTQAARIEEALEKCYHPDNGLMNFSLKKDTMTPWQNSDFEGGELTPQIPGYEDSSFADFMNYENTGMVQGTFLAALCFKYLATHNPVALKKAQRTFQGIRKVYDLSQSIAEGFYCKPWGGLTDETSSDQYIYTMLGLDEYYPLASKEEQKQIRSMIVSMARFWLNHHYDWKYYGRMLHWRESRFISFMALALKYGGGTEFKTELERLIHRLENEFVTPFGSTVSENLTIQEDGTQYLSTGPESALSTFLSLETAMKDDLNPRFTDICRDSMEYGKISLADDGTVYSMLTRNSNAEPFHEIPKEQTRYVPFRYQSPIYGLHGPFRKGGMQSIMFARFVLAYEEFEPTEQGIKLAEKILHSTAEKHLTWYEDPYGIFPDEIRWMTNVFSGDAAVNWLWCYWKLRLREQSELSGN